MSKNNRTGLYIADIKKTKYDYDYWHNLMPPARIERCDRFRIDEDKKRCVLGWALLMYSLSDYECKEKITSADSPGTGDCGINLTVSEIWEINDFSSDILMHYCESYREEDKGKPYFANSRTNFNISHSEDKVIDVLSTGKVGCDVERKSTDCLKIARRFFSCREYEYLREIESESVREREFLKLWTLKEAFVKTNGIGIAYPLDEVSFIDENGLFRNCITDLNGNNYIAQNVDMNDEYAYSVCCESE